MNRRDAKVIAAAITNSQLADMFDRARKSITDWKSPSVVNRSLSKGTAWNILFGAFESEKSGDIRSLGKINMVREFGNYLPDNAKPVRKQRAKGGDVHHQEPIFDFSK